MIHNPADDSLADRTHGSGSARRRRERRLRSFLRHERMTVRMDLSAALHHSSFRGAGPEMYDTPRRQRTANSRVGPAEYYELSSDDGRRTGRRSGQRHCLSRGRRRGTGGTMASRASWSIVSMSLCRRWENSCRISCSSFPHSLPVVAEPVIEVPKILLHDVPLRRLCRVTQLAEQLVEVPTVLSYSPLQ